MATEQLQCGYHIGQCNFGAHLYTTKNDPIEREKLEKESRAQVEESTNDTT